MDTLRKYFIRTIFVFAGKTEIGGLIKVPGDFIWFPGTLFRSSAWNGSFIRVFIRALIKVRVDLFRSPGTLIRFPFPGVKLESPEP